MKKLFLFVVSLALVGAGCGQAEFTPVSVQENGAGKFETYDKALLADADDGNVVIFFHASWCPTCQALEEAILRDAAQIPDNLTILKADFDTEIDLRKQYGVTLQHTLVHVDSQGEEITQWSGGNTLDSIVSQLQ